MTGRFVSRALFVLVGLVGLALVAPGCADGGDPGGRRDAAGGEGGMDGGGGGVDAQTPDGGAPDVVTGEDGGPRETVRTCEACVDDLDCADGSYCAMLVTGGSACLPGCNPDLPMCNRRFSCIFDMSGTGVDATICAPIGGPCCVDEDGDGYGIGVGCMGEDCNDMDEEVHPDRTEICDGLDTNCNRTVDESPNDCESGRCDAQSDGTYESISGGTCAAAVCGSGTLSDCGLYTCNEGGADGISCATVCAVGGVDDDTFCIATAHCDAGACVPDVPDGMTCDEDTDCSAAHCDNDFCCASGICCNTVADCPGGGAVTLLCEDPINCQGARGSTECNATSQCVTMGGIPDDSGCTTTTTARVCAPYRPIMCTGAINQTARDCPTSCVGDGDCTAEAHCTVNLCIPDLPPGSSCSRPQDCQAGLTCTDGVCCTGACAGGCEACDLPGTEGMCTRVPTGGDPDSECPGFSCAGYFDGFSGGSDQCFRRMDVTDGAAQCNGAGACTGAATVCPGQPRGVLQIDCNDTCQTPAAGTCSSTTAGACTNRDNPAMRTMCGDGVCRRDVQMCTSGMPTPCTPGAPAVETCNALDDDCDRSSDEGTGSALCGTPPQAMATGVMCLAGPPRCVIGTGTCLAGFANIDGTFTNGCECAVGTNTACSVPINLGSIAAPGSVSQPGILPAGEDRWYTVSFAPGARTPGAGVPRIQLTGGAATHYFEILNSCTAGSTQVCQAGGSGGRSTNITDWVFQDNASTPGPRQWTTHSTTWPSMVYIRVYRRSGSPTDCASASFTLTVTR